MILIALYAYSMPARGLKRLKKPSMHLFAFYKPFRAVAGMESAHSAIEYIACNRG